MKEKWKDAKIIEKKLRLTPVLNIIIPWFLIDIAFIFSILQLHSRASQQLEIIIVLIACIIGNILFSMLFIMIKDVFFKEKIKRVKIVEENK